jgi:Zn-dependent protease
MIASEHGQLYEAVCLILPLVFAIVCHEVAHGLVARALGDTTAADAGRLTLNPLRHVDPIGTVVVPGLLALAHAPVFGWAKPVPVNPWRLRGGRQGMMLVAIAGPAMNLCLAALAAVALGLVVRAAGLPGAGSEMTGVAGFAADNCVNFLAINLYLALFNLLPVPPFDGSHIVEGLLPTRLADTYAHTRRFGMLLILLLVVVLPSVMGVSIVARFVDPPFAWMYEHYVRLAEVVAGVSVQAPPA